MSSDGAARFALLAPSISSQSDTTWRAARISPSLNLDIGRTLQAIELAVARNPLFCDPVFLKIEHVAHGIFHIGRIATVRFVVDEPAAPDGLRHVKRLPVPAVGCAVQIVKEHLEFDI